jgi:Uncharacterised protein family, YAP/Alf4/glomulin
MDLFRIVSQTAEEQQSPLDFEELPRSADKIPLERHGALLLLAARLSMTTLYGNQDSLHIPVFPDLAKIFLNFIGNHRSLDGLGPDQPNILLDSLLTLAAIAINRPIEATENYQQYEDFVLALTACTARQAYNSIRRIPLAIARSHPSQMIRFKLIQKILKNEDLLYAKESAIGWLKDEILIATGDKTTGATVAAVPLTESSVFADPHHFLDLFTLLFDPARLALDTPPDIVLSWLKFTQSLTPSVHAALSLYYILISSENIRECLALEKTYIYFCQKFLTRLKSMCQEFEADMTHNSGPGRIEAAIGEDACQMGMMRSVGIISDVIGQIEDVLFDLCKQAKTAITEPTPDGARVAEINSMTMP